MKNTGLKKILLVEDQPLVALATLKNLRSFGFDAISAATGEEAIRLSAEDRTIDLVLMDMDLGPGIPGSEAAREILKARTVPIVFLTSHSGKEMVEKVRDITRYGYVLKSGGDFVLRSSIEMALELFEANNKISSLRIDAIQRKLFENIGDVIVIMDRDGIIRYKSPNVEKWFGWASDKLIGTDYRKYIHPDDTEGLRARFARLVPEPTASLTTECRFLCKDGNYKWIEITLVNLLSDPDIRGILGNYHDVGERKRFERSLMENELRFKNMADNSPALIWESTLDKKSVYFNQRWLEYTGRTLQEELGFGWMVGIHPDDLNGCFEEFAKAFDEHKRFSGEYRLRKANGEYGWVFDQGNPILDPQGDCIGFIGSCIEIDERKQAEEALRNYRNKLDRIISNSSDLIYEVDDQLRYTFVSDNFEKVFGYGPDELLGSKVTELMHPDDAGTASDKIARRTGSAENTVDEWRFRNKEGEYRTFECHGSAYPGKDGAMTTVVIAHDVTDRNIAEGKIRSLLAEKELILKEVHHRVKNNLNVIISLLSLQAGALEDPVAVGALQDAKNRVHSLLLLYGKLYQTDDVTQLNMKDYFPDLIREIVNNFPDGASVRVETDMDDFALKVNEAQSVGIIINELLTNIMKYAFVGGVGGTIFVSARSADGLVRIAVRDDGVGIPPSIDFENSNGFGLTLVGGLAKQLKGTIRIERCRGTTVVLEFEA